jgi:hypothetical protein
MVAVEAGAGGSMFRLGEGEVGVVVELLPLDEGVFVVVGVLVLEGDVVVVVLVPVVDVPDVSLDVPEPLFCSPTVPVPSGEAVWVPVFPSITWPIEG